jgi:hypothetical protein
VRSGVRNCPRAAGPRSPRRPSIDQLTLPPVAANVMQPKIAPHRIPHRIPNRIPHKSTAPMIVSYFFSSEYALASGNPGTFVPRSPLRNRWNGVSRFFSRNPYFDRTNTLPFYLPKVKSICPLPEGVSKAPYKDICLSRAKQLIDSGREIHLAWSGGIDSTTALVSLLMNGVRNDQLRVAMGTNSINEYPWFYEKYIKGKIRHNTDCSLQEALLQYPDSLVVTGELNDQIFCIAAVLDRYPETFLESYKKHIPGEIITFLDPLVVKSPRPVETVFDFFGLANFILKWQFAKIRKLRFNATLAKNTVHFFDADEFQRWAMYTDEPKILKTPQTFKYPAKKVIYDFTGDKDYLEHKLKVNSIKDESIANWKNNKEKSLSYSNVHYVHLDHGEYRVGLPDES